MAAKSPKSRMLGIQPDAFDPVSFSHFDCWVQNEEALAVGIHSDPLEWTDPQAEKIKNHLVKEWNTLTKSQDFDILLTKHNTDHDAFFTKARYMLAKAGFYVYLSDTMIEVYQASDMEKHYDEEDIEDMLYD